MNNKILSYLCLVLSSCAAIGQTRTNEVFDHSIEVDVQEFISDPVFKALAKRYDDFRFDMDFRQREMNEIVLISTFSSRRGNIFVIRWDDDTLKIYHENFRGEMPNFKNEVVAFSSDTRTYQEFVKFVPPVPPKFYRHSRQAIPNYRTDFLIFRRTGGVLDWGLVALNGKDFKDESGYPSKVLNELIDHVFIEFGFLA